MSEIRANTISNQAGTGPITLTGQSAAKSWINFNGTGTVAIRESFNTSGLVDNGTGDYTVNFATAMVDANYAVPSSASLNNTRPVSFNPDSLTTLSVRGRTGAGDSAGGGIYDAFNVMVVVHR